MKTKRYQVPYSKGFIRFSLPRTMWVNEIVSRPVEPLQHLPDAIKEALEHPTASKPLRDLARPGMRACIVFTDITRACPDNLLVPALLEELIYAGIRENDITLLCGIGLHRHSTREDMIAKLGAGIVDRYRVIDNEPRNLSAQVEVGLLPDGRKIQLNRAVVEADIVISTGIVEPHQYAGYSGGCKTVAIGAAGEDFIAYTHGPAFVDHPGTRLGRIDDNPFQEAVTVIARRANLRFILNVILDDNQRVLCVQAGEPQQTFQRLVAFAKSIYEVPIPHQYDIAIGGVGFPKDTNLYQASRAPSYLFFAPTPVVREGGFLIIPARCEEGAGSGVGEQRFFSAMRDAPDIQAILDESRKNGYPPGQQRAFVMAKVLEQAHVIIVGSECPEMVAACKMIPAETIEEAVVLATQAVGQSCNVLVIPHALLTLPILKITDLGAKYE
jgi:nickel-dependent lactate racemase